MSGDAGLRLPPAWLFPRWASPRWPLKTQCFHGAGSQLARAHGPEKLELPWRSLLAGHTAEFTLLLPLLAANMTPAAFLAALPPGGGRNVLLNTTLGTVWQNHARHTLFMHC